MRLAKFLGQILVFLASMAFIAGLSIFIVGGYLMTWPVMRLSPRSARTQSLVGLAVALMALARAYGLDEKVTEKVAAGDDGD